MLGLLRRTGIGRPLSIFLLSPEADALQKKWRDLLPEATVTSLPGLPEGTEPLADCLSSLADVGIR